MLVNTVRKLRTDRKMTQETLAALVCTSNRTIGNIENCKHDPSCELCIRIAQVFGKRVEDIFEIK